MESQTTILAVVFNAFVLCAFCDCSVPDSDCALTQGGEKRELNVCGKWLHTQQEVKESTHKERKLCSHRSKRKVRLCA